MNQTNFDYTETTPKSRARLPESRMHHRRNPELVSGTLAAELVAWRPIHIGSGNLARPADLDLADTTYPLLKAFFRTGPEDGRAVPAASLKGVVRSIVEAITPSCINKARQRGRYGLPLDYRQEGECQYDPAKGRRSLCPACRMFGAMGYQGQVRFADAPQTAGGHALITMPAQHQPKPTPGYRKFYYHRPPEAGNLPLEVCPAGSRFALRGDFVNLTPAEVGVLLLALGQPLAPDGQPLCWKIGGGKNAGLGSIRVEGLALRVWQDPRQAYLSYETEQTLLEAGHDDYLAAARGPDSPLQQDRLKDLQRILGCPLQGGT